MRRTYVELADLLTRGETPSAELEKRVNAARASEAAWVRDGISERPTEKDKGACLRCHLTPERTKELRAARGSSGEGTALAGKGYYSTPKLHAETDQAHIEGEFGKEGMAKVHGLAPKVDALLTDAQKDVLGSFACCLIPPKNLSDPTRVGQADVTDRKIELLRNVRRVPEAAWAARKDALVDRLLDLVQARKAGITESQLVEYRQRLGGVFDETRKLSDTEFEMEKEDLCRRLDANPPAPPSAEDSRRRELKQACFMLMPGSAKVYDAVLGRMAKAR